MFSLCPIYEYLYVIGNAVDCVGNSQYAFTFLAGNVHELTNPSPETSLLEHLRLTLNLTGAKLSCNAGGCGACTVTISRKDFKGESYFSISLVLILLLFLSMSKIQIEVEFCRLSTLTRKNDCSLKNAISF